MDQGKMADEGASKDLLPFGRWTLLAVSDLTPNPRNPRKHSRAQVQAIAKSIEAFGFTAPILIDKNGQIIAGHGRYEAALLLGLSQVPVIGLEHLSEAKARAYMLADNKLTDRSSWNDEALALQLKELTDLALDFEIEAIGFEPPEIDLRIQSLDTTPEDAADNFEVAAGPVVSKPGDLWLLDSHRLYCGSALDLAAYDAVLADQKSCGGVHRPSLQRENQRPRIRQGKDRTRRIPHGIGRDDRGGVHGIPASSV
jgi:hypothetical protein